MMNSILCKKYDAILIIQVIINIVDNAIKYTPKGSMISIETFKPKDFVEIQIADDGAGISDNVEKLLKHVLYCKVARLLTDVADLV